MFLGSSKEECREVGITPPSRKADALTYLERVSKKDGREDPLLKDSAAAERMKEIEESRSRRKLIVMHKRKKP